jgi:hypothetical protein
VEHDQGGVTCFSNKFHIHSFSAFNTVILKAENFFMLPMLLFFTFYRK